LSPFIRAYTTDKKENSLANQSCSYYNKPYNRLFTFSVFFMRMVLIRREIWPH
jgi:amino acid permease